MTFKFHSEARKEFFEADEFYEDKVVGPGDNFIDEVKKHQMSLNNSWRRRPKPRKLKEGSWFLAFLME